MRRLRTGPAFADRASAHPESRGERAQPRLGQSGSDSAPSNVLHEFPKAVAAGVCVAGRYRIINKLAKGGMSEIFVVCDVRSGHRVALKVLAPELVSSERYRRRFEAEVDILRMLNHSNILQIQDDGVDRGVPFAVTELLTGENLQDRLRHGPLPPGAVLRYAKQIANGLAAAHERGVLHRDLKPANVFVTLDETIKILDFGLSKCVLPTSLLSPEDDTRAQDTDPGTILGTVAYMSPEQLCGRNVDNRSDIFSFGVLILEMLWGRNPFLRDCPAETIASILGGDLDSKQFTNSRGRMLGKIAMKCIRLDSVRRFQSMEEISRGLTEAR